MKNRDKTIIEKKTNNNPETCVRLSNAIPLNVGQDSDIRKTDAFLPYYENCITSDFVV